MLRGIKTLSVIAGGWTFTAAIPAGMSALAIAGERITIGFNDPASLRAIPPPYSGAPITFANFYTEQGMTFSDGVEPPDPALSPVLQYHYHLLFESPDICMGLDRKLGADVLRQAGPHHLSRIPAELG